MGVVLCVAISTDMYSYFKQHFFQSTLKFIWQMAAANNKRRKQIDNTEPKRRCVYRKKSTAFEGDPMGSNHQMTINGLCDPGQLFNLPFSQICRM